MHPNLHTSCNIAYGDNSEMDNHTICIKKTQFTIIKLLYK